MKALVIYDATGKIWSIFYGEDQVPQGLLALFVDIPDGGQLERIEAGCSVEQELLDTICMMNTIMAGMGEVSHV